MSEAEVRLELKKDDAAEAAAQREEIYDCTPSSCLVNALEIEHAQ
jgi:hypothetical protein